MGKEKDKSKEEAEKFPDLRYGPLDYSVSKITSYLNDDQKATLQAFRDSIPTIWPETLTGVEELFLSDSTLCRYLRARDWHLSKAQKMIVETLKWRREYKPWAITADDVDCELNNPGKLYRGGFDKYQRPILIMKPRKDNTGNEVREIKVKYLVYCLEKCIRAGETQDREKMSLLIDYSKYSNLSGMSMIKMSLEVLKILSDHYPERLGSAFMVHASWSFSFFWKAISPFLDPVTKKKIFFISKLEELKEWIDEDVLEVEYGGKNEFEYRYEEMKMRDHNLFPPYNEAGELVHVSGTATNSEEAPKKHKKKKSKKKLAESQEREESETAESGSTHAKEEEVEGSGEEESTSSHSKKKHKKKTSKHHLEASAEKSSADPTEAEDPVLDTTSDAEASKEHSTSSKSSKKKHKKHHDSDNEPEQH